MPVTVRKWIVLPPAEEIIALQGKVEGITPYDTEDDAKKEAVRQAIVSGRERVVAETTLWAAPDLTITSINAQINTIPS